MATLHGGIIIILDLRYVALAYLEVFALIKAALSLLGNLPDGPSGSAVPSGVGVQSLPGPRGCQAPARRHSGAPENERACYLPR